MPRFLFALLMGICLFTFGTNQLSAQDDSTEKLQKEQAAFEAARTKQKSPQKLTIGDSAPVLDIEHWIQDGKGRFDKVTKFESGKVYVVEFWATWCGPCISSMPHIVSLQKKHAKDVQFISVTDEKLSVVKKFLEREIRDASGNDPKTYGELTSAYCLTSDADESTYRDYMQAADQNGIPCAFLIGKQGKIEWIGHPMSIDEPLEEVVADQWDRDAFVREYLERQQITKVLSNVGRKMRMNDIDGAVEVLDEYVKNGKLEDEKSRFRSIKLQILASSVDHKDAAAKCALEQIASDSHDASSANDLAWSLYLLADAGDFEDQKVLAAALKLAEENSVDAGELKPYILDTVAHLQHFNGEYKEALKTQKRAYRIAEDGEKEQFKEFLDELEAFEKKYGGAADK